MHQYLFFVGDFPIRAYGLILSLSIILATGVAYFLAKQDGRWHNHIVDIGIYSGIAGVVGARLWDVFFFDWAYYSHHLSEIFYVWQRWLFKVVLFLAWEQELFMLDVIK